MQVQPERALTTREEMTRDLRALGVRAGGVLLVHMSYRSVKPVDGGPAGVIEALRASVGPAGTIVMPSWGDEDDVPYDPANTRVAGDLGVTAELLRLVPGARRSDHPFAFAALGPHAERITADPLPIPPHAPESPVGRVFDLDGQVLLLGCGHDSDTTIHLGEVLGGAPYRVPKYCTVSRDGIAVRVDYAENDCCCARFTVMDEWLRARGAQVEGRVGHAHARLARSRDIVTAARQAVERDPLVFLHDPAEGCAECDASRLWAARNVANQRSGV
jgi:aminoglycoside N3'-acetyltransferase